VTTGDGKALVVSAEHVGRLDGVTLNGTVDAVGRLEVKTGQSIHGTADIFFYDSVRAQSGTTIIEPGIRIHGGTSPGDANGGVGNDGAAVVNGGTIQADVPGKVIRLHGSNVTNAGTLRVDAGAEIIAAGNVRFDDGGRFVVGGDGSMTINGTTFPSFDLRGTGDALEVLPLLGGGAYTGQTIITHFGLLGQFDFVTPGITVQYSAHGVQIFGTPIPEPVATTFTGLAVLLLGRQERNNRRRVASNR
jgi:hypothetical protein